MADEFHARVQAQLKLALLGDCGCIKTLGKLENEARSSGLTGAEIDAALGGRSFEARTAAALAYAWWALPSDAPQPSESFDFVGMLMTVQINGSTGGIGNINYVGVHDSEHGAQKAWVTSRNGYDGTVLRAGFVHRASKFLSQPLGSLGKVFNSLLGTVDLVQDFVVIILDREGVTEVAVLNAERNSPKMLCHVVVHKWGNQVFQRFFPTQDEQYRVTRTFPKFVKEKVFLVKGGVIRIIKMVNRLRKELGFQNV